jgi:hypothetical protein
MPKSARIGNQNHRLSIGIGKAKNPSSPATPPTRRMSGARWPHNRHRNTQMRLQKTVSTNAPHGRMARAIRGARDTATLSSVAAPRAPVRGGRGEERGAAGGGASVGPPDCRPANRRTHRIKAVQRCAAIHIFPGPTTPDRPVARQEKTSWRYTAPPKTRTACGQVVRRPANCLARAPSFA